MLNYFNNRRINNLTLVKFHSIMRVSRERRWYYD